MSGRWALFAIETAEPGHQGRCPRPDPRDQSDQNLRRDLLDPTPALLDRSDRSYCHWQMPEVSVPAFALCE